ncbi:10399_t:CDS:2, partial [Paraglomus occultum]
HTAIIYEMSIPFKGLYVFREVLRTQLPAGKRNVVLLRRCASTFLLFKEMLTRSLNDLEAFIEKATLSTPPTDDNANSFMTQMRHWRFSCINNTYERN